MEINGNSSTISLISQVNKIADSNQQNSAKTESTAQQSNGSDTVQLSQEAREANRAFSQLQGLPEIREEKVGEIKNQVETGTYRVDGGKIAVSMLNESLENNSILNSIDMEV